MVKEGKTKDDSRVKWSDKLCAVAAAVLGVDGLECRNCCRDAVRQEEEGGRRACNEDTPKSGLLQTRPYIRNRNRTRVTPQFAIRHHRCQRAVVFRVVIGNTSQRMPP